MSDGVPLTVADASQVGEARRAAAALTTRLGFDETEAGKVALVVTEAASNLAKHGGGGELLLRVLARGDVPGVEVLALDRGPGMADVARCLGGGFSTAGTAGHGLGAIARLASTFDVHSAPGAGTALVARLWARSVAAPPAAGEVGVVCVPKPGQLVCGDAWGVEERAGRVRVLVADGLGHGPEAAAAAAAAVRAFRADAAAEPVPLMQTVHAALRPTRGAAVAVAEIDPAAGLLRFCGVGNVAGVILSGGASRSVVSHNGTLGYEARKFQQFDYPFPPGSVLVLHSDGLASQWRIEPTSGLTARDPALVAGVLYRDFRRGRDDVTVVAARAARQGEGTT
jgi:anti-sigma regulatory factor (Ser/Thr protein kinase)